MISSDTMQNTSEEYLPARLQKIENSHYHLRVKSQGLRPLYMLIQTNMIFDLNMRFYSADV